MCKSTHVCKGTVKQGRKLQTQVWTKGSLYNFCNLSINLKSHQNIRSSREPHAGCDLEDGLEGDQRNYCHSRS